MNRSASDPRSRASGKEWAGLAVLVLPALLISMDLSVLYLAVPELTAALRPTGTQLLWITDIYGFMLAGLLITMGAVGDRVGRRRLLMIGVAAFGVASLVAAYSSSAEMLIVARALLGVAGATLGPSALALISNMFRDGRQRAVAIAVWATGLSVGGALGPVVGGALLEWFWWGSVFLLAVPVMVVLLASARILLPEHRSTGAYRPDLISVTLSMVAVLAVVYGLKQAAHGDSAWSVVVPVIVGLAAGVVFGRRQRALAEPMLDLALFRASGVSVSLAVNVVAFLAVLGLGLFVAQYLQLVLGMSPLVAGFATVPMFAGFIGGAMISPVLIHRVRPEVVMCGGLVVGSAGAAMLAMIGPESGPVLVVAGSVVLAAGLGPVLPIVPNVVLRSAPPERAGVASGLVETSTEFGGALGIAILGVLGGAFYHRGMAGSVAESVPPRTASAARDTLGGATDAAAQLPADLAAPLLEAARSAFVGGMNLAASACAVLLLAMTIVAYGTLRGVRTKDRGRPGNEGEIRLPRGPSQPAS